MVDVVNMLHTTLASASVRGGYLKTAGFEKMSYKTSAFIFGISWSFVTGLAVGWVVRSLVV